MARARRRQRRSRTRSRGRTADATQPCGCGRLQTRATLMADRDPFANPQDLLRRVYAYVAYGVGNRVDAEDFTSDTFERALRYRHTFDSRKGKPLASMLGIARTCVYETQRQG